MSPPPYPGVVFLVQEVDALGGSERQARALASALVRAGTPVRLLSCTDRVPPKRWIGSVFPEDREGVRIHRIPRAVFAATAGTLLRRRRSWRVLYAVGLAMGAVAARLGRLLGAPVVVKLCGSGPRGDMAYLGSLPQVLRRSVQADLAQTTLVCLSDDMQREVREAGFPPERTVRLTNGVDLAPVDPVRPDPPAEHRILYAGRLDPFKGVETLVDATSDLAREGLDVRLLLAGEGPEARALEDLAQALDVGARVQLLGRREDVPGLLRGATCCCLPSRSEGQSNVLLEAMAAGAPIVATDLQANREVVGDAALLVPPGDPSALADALRAVLTDAELRASLSAAAKVRARPYSLDSVAAAHAELFASLPCADRRPGALTWAARFAGARAAELLRLFA